MPKLKAPLVFQDGTVQKTAAADNNAKLVKWRKALGKVRGGLGNAKVLCLGDSLISGSGGSGSTGYGADSRKFNFVSRVKDLMNSYHVPTRADMVLGTGGISGYTTFDPRYALTNWADNQNLDGAIGKVFYSSTNGGTLVFTPTTSWDRVEIFYPAAGSQGTFDVSVGGSSIGTVNAAGSTDIASSTFNATLGIHGVTITKTNSNGNYILGIRVWDSTKSEVEIIQAGWSGAVASAFVTNSLPWDALGEITKLAPDLTVIALSINDAVAGTSIGTFTSQLQTIITTALASGDCILTTGVPSAISVVSLATQQTYIDAIETLAVTNGIVFINQFSRFVSYEISNPSGFYTDTLHPNGIGYADMAQKFFAELTNI